MKSKYLFFLWYIYSINGFYILSYTNFLVFYFLFLYKIKVIKMYIVIKRDMLNKKYNSSYFLNLFFNNNSSLLIKEHNITLYIKSKWIKVLYLLCSPFFFWLFYWNKKKRKKKNIIFFLKKKVLFFNFYFKIV